MNDLSKFFARSDFTAVLLPGAVVVFAILVGTNGMTLDKIANLQLGGFGALLVAALAMGLFLVASGRALSNLLFKLISLPTEPSQVFRYCICQRLDPDQFEQLCDAMREDYKVELSMKERRRLPLSPSPNGERRRAWHFTFPWMRNATKRMRRIEKHSIIDRIYTQLPTDQLKIYDDMLLQHAQYRGLGLGALLIVLLYILVYPQADRLNVGGYLQRYPLSFWSIAVCASFGLLMLYMMVITAWEGARELALRYLDKPRPKKRLRRKASSRRVRLLRYHPGV